MDYDNLKYDDKLMFTIIKNVSLIGIVDSYFKSIIIVQRRERSNMKQ